jgi:predicted AlkP superfamily phosphohydrolase/phosphomutase
MSAIRARPLVVLGLKIGDADEIERWAAEGRLPVIRSVMERGCHGRLAGPDRLSEHGTATTLFTGAPLDRHGFYYFRQLVPGTYRLAPFGAADVEESPFWTRPEVFAGEVATIDVPEVKPRPGVKGSQIKYWCFSHSDRHWGGQSAEPGGLLEDVRRRFGESPDLLGDTAHGSGTPEEDRACLDELLSSVRTKGDLCRYVFSLGRPDLAVAVFDETHAATHRFWPYRPEAAGGGFDDEDLRNAIRTIYEATDREIGRLLEAIGEEANVVVFSLFGMQDQYPTEGFNETLCSALGYQVSKASNGGGGHRPIDLARRFVPERWRAALSRRLPTGPQEALLADRIANGTDWRRTTAFSLPSLYTAFVQVNLRGREPGGIVDPADYDSVLDRIEADLRELSHPATDEPLIDSVVRTSKVFGDVPPERLPDLFIEWKSGPAFLDRAIHPRAELVQRIPSYCPGSEETMVGFLAAAGPDVTGRGEVGEVASIDFAPTLLGLLGLPRPGDMPGRLHAGIVTRTP